CAADYGGGGSDLSSLDSFHGGDGGGGSSVASLLRQERAFRQKNGVLGSREAEEREVARKHANTHVTNAGVYHHGGGVPALVPLNNVGLPVRLRRQPRRM
ncbi:unnamed protein product, partial [Pylaiella littoralis]